MSFRTLSLPMLMSTKSLSNWPLLSGSSWHCSRTLVFIWHHCFQFFSAYSLNSPLHFNRLVCQKNGCWIACPGTIYFPVVPASCLSHRRKSGDCYLWTNGCNFSFHLPQQLFYVVDQLLSPEILPGNSDSVLVLFYFIRPPSLAFASRRLPLSSFGHNSPLEITFILDASALPAYRRL